MVVMVATGVNKNESWKEEVYDTHRSQRGFHQMPLRVTEETQVFSQVAEDGSKVKA